METKKIQTFTDLVSWQEAHQLLLTIYRVTRAFPKEELFILVSQMRRCALSISSNIAEGFSRKTMNDKLHFYTMAQGSTTELQNQLIASRDLGYINQTVFDQITEQTVVVRKLLHGLMRSIRG